MQKYLYHTKTCRTSESSGSALAYESARNRMTNVVYKNGLLYFVRKSGDFCMQGRTLLRKKNMLLHTSESRCSVVKGCHSCEGSNLDYLIPACAGMTRKTMQPILEKRRI